MSLIDMFFSMNSLFLLSFSKIIYKIEKSNTKLLECRSEKTQPQEAVNVNCINCRSLTTFGWNLLQFWTYILCTIFKRPSFIHSKWGKTKATTTLKNLGNTWKERGRDIVRLWHQQPSCKDCIKSEKLQKSPWKDTSIHWTLCTWEEQHEYNRNLLKLRYVSLKRGGLKSTENQKVCMHTHRKKVSTGNQMLPWQNQQGMPLKWSRFI